MIWFIIVYLMLAVPAAFYLADRADKRNKQELIRLINKMITEEFDRRGVK